MVEIKFVDVGEGITEGHIQKWLVKDGDAVKEDQAVIQIETDKAVVNMPSPTNGILHIVAKEGADVKVGDILATVGDSNAPAAQKTPGMPNGSGSAKEPNQKVAEPHAGNAVEEVLAAPSIRKLAEEMHIRLENVKGTGPHGRITESDLKDYAKDIGSAAYSTQEAANVAQSGQAQQADIERVPLTQTRKAIAKNMELSWQIPRASHIDLINAGALSSIVEREKSHALAELNVKLSYLPFIIKAAVQALKENPRFNASYDKDRLEVLVKKHYNIGIAAEAPDGLKVVVVKDSDKKSIIEIAGEISDLHKKVTENTIGLDEMKDTSFTITNVGSLGGGFIAIPMINYPDVAILGITMIRDMPVVENGSIKVGKVLPFTVTFDHRVVDGAEAVKFGNAIKKYLEDPDFLEML